MPSPESLSLHDSHSEETDKRSSWLSLQLALKPAIATTLQCLLVAVAEAKDARMQGCSNAGDPSA
jgi:hypothetical protein